MTRPGTVRTISVPELAELTRVNLAPMRAALSRMPRRPKCPDSIDLITDHRMHLAGIAAQRQRCLDPRRSGFEWSRLQALSLRPNCRCVFDRDPDQGAASTFVE